MAGVNDVVIAGGVQAMSQIPNGSAMLAGQPLGFNILFLVVKGGFLDMVM